MSANQKQNQTSKKAADEVPVSAGQIQIHFGNVEVLKLKLLEAINKNLVEVLTILKQVKES
jgi:hypothetical protein